MNIHLFTSPDKNEQELFIATSKLDQGVNEGTAEEKNRKKNDKIVHYGIQEPDKKVNIKNKEIKKSDFKRTEANELYEPFQKSTKKVWPAKKNGIKRWCRRMPNINIMKRSAEYKRIIKIAILVSMALAFFLSILLLTSFSFDSGSGEFETYEKTFKLNVEIMNCKILINENDKVNNSKIDYEYSINYLLDYNSEKPQVKAIHNSNEATIILKSKKLLWRTCVLRLDIPKHTVFKELNIICSLECILVSNHPNITIVQGFWESNLRFDMNWRGLSVNEELYFQSIYGTFQLNEFKSEGETLINLEVGDVILQTSSDIKLDWTNPSFTYCFAGPHIIEETRNNCTYITYKPSTEGDADTLTANRTGICSGVANICREEVCGFQSKAFINQTSGNTYVNLLPSSGVDVSYDPSLQIAKGLNNSALDLEDNFDKEIQKAYNSSIKNKDPILIINLGNKNLQQQSFQKWIISSNPSFAYLRPWWLAVFSASLLTSRTIEYSGIMAPGICPYHFSATIDDYYETQVRLKSYFKLDQAEINFIKPMNSMEPSNIYQNGSGIVNFYTDKPKSERWIKVVQNTGGTFMLEDIDVFTRNYVLPTVILSFIGAGLIGFAITRLFMLGIVLAHKKIMKIARHAQSYKENSVDFRASDEEKVIQELLEVENTSENIIINIGNILKEGSFLGFMKTVPRVSAFFGFYSYLLIKTYVLNSVEDFCNVVFIKKSKEEIEEIMKDPKEREKSEMKEIKLKYNYEKFCFLNHYPEQSLMENIRIFHSYGYDLIQDKDALAFSNLIERKNTKIPPNEELLKKKEEEILDCIFNGIYERSSIETDTIFLDEIKSNCRDYSEKLKLSETSYLESEKFIQKNGLKKIYKKSLKLAYNEKISRKDVWYSVLFLKFINLLGWIFERVVNAFIFLISKFIKKRYQYRFKKFKTRKKSFHIIDEELLKEQFNLISSPKPIQIDYSEPQDKQERKIKAIKKTLYYPYYFVHELMFIALHFLVTGILISPFILMTLLYEFSYEPYSTISQDELISLKDLYWTPFDLLRRLRAYIWWNLIIACFVIIFVIFNILDDIIYFLDTTFPEDRKLLKFQDEMTNKHNTFKPPGQANGVLSSKYAECKSMVFRFFKSIYWFWSGRRFINIFWLSVIFMIFCYSSYVGLVLLWLLLGAIINPNTYLVYSAASLTFITFVSTKHYQFGRLSANGYKVIKAIVHKNMQVKVNEITKMLSQELGRAMIGLNNIKDSNHISEFAVQQSKEFGVENEFNEIKSYCDNPEKILDGVFDNLDTTIINPDDIRLRIIEKKNTLVTKAQKTFKTYFEAYNIPENVINLMTDLVLKTNKEKITESIADLLDKKIPKEFNIHIQKNLIITLISLVATHKSSNNRHELYYQLIKSIIMNILFHSQKEDSIDNNFLLDFGRLISMIMNQSDEQNGIILEIVPTVLKLLGIELPHWLNSIFDNVLPRLIRGSGQEVKKAIIRLIAENLEDEKHKKVVAFLLLLDKSPTDGEIQNLKLDDRDSLRLFFEQNFGTDELISNVLAFVSLILKGGYTGKSRENREAEEIDESEEEVKSEVKDKPGENFKPEKNFNEILTSLMNDLSFPNFFVELIELLVELGDTKLNSGKLTNLYKIGKAEKYFGDLVCLLTENMWKNHYNNRLPCLKESDLIKLMARKIGTYPTVLFNMLRIFWTALESDQLNPEEDFNMELNSYQIEMEVFRDLINEDLSRIPENRINNSGDEQNNHDAKENTIKSIGNASISGSRDIIPLEKKELMSFFFKTFNLKKQDYDNVLFVSKNCEYFSKHFKLNKEYFKYFIFILNKYQLKESLNFFLKNSDIKCSSNKIQLDEMITQIIDLDKNLKSTCYINSLTKFMRLIGFESKEKSENKAEDKLQKASFIRKSLGQSSEFEPSNENYFNIMINMIEQKKLEVIENANYLIKMNKINNFQVIRDNLEKFLKLNLKEVDLNISDSLRFDRENSTQDLILSFKKPILENMAINLWANISKAFENFYEYSPYTQIPLTKGFKMLKVMALIMNWNKDLEFMKNDQNFIDHIENLGVPIRAIETILELKYFYTIDPNIFLSKFVRKEKETVQAILSILFMNPEYRLISQYLKIPRYQVDSMLSFLKLWTIEKCNSSDLKLLNEIGECDSVSLWCTKLGIFKSELWATLKIFFNLLKESELDSIVSDLHMDSCFRIDIFKSIIVLFSNKILPEPLNDKGLEREFIILRKKLILLKSLDILNGEEFLYELDYRAGNFHNLRTLVFYLNKPSNMIRSIHLSSIYFYVLGCMICKDFSEIDPNFIISEFIYADKYVLNRNSIKSIAYWFFKKFNIHPLILLYKLGHKETVSYVEANLTHLELYDLKVTLNSNDVDENRFDEQKFITIFRKLLNEEQIPVDKKEYASITKLLWEQKTILLQNFKIIFLISIARNFKNTEETYGQSRNKIIDSLITELVNINGSRVDKKPKVIEGVSGSNLEWSGELLTSNSMKTLEKFCDFEVRITPKMKEFRPSHSLNEKADKELFTLLENSEKNIINFKNTKKSPKEIIVDRYSSKFGMKSERAKAILKMFLENPEDASIKSILNVIQSHLKSNTYTFNLILSLITLSDLKSLEKQENIPIISKLKLTLNTNTPLGELKMKKETSTFVKKSKCMSEDLIELTELLEIKLHFFGLIKTILEIKFNDKNIVRFNFIEKALRKKKDDKKHGSSETTLEYFLNELLNELTHLEEKQKLDIFSLVKMYTGDKIEWENYITKEIKESDFNDLSPNLINFVMLIIKKMVKNKKNDTEYGEKDIQIISLYSLMDPDIKIGLPEDWEICLIKEFINEDFNKFPMLKLAFQVMRAILKNDCHMIALLANEAKNLHLDSNEESSSVIKNYKNLSYTALLKHFIKNHGLQTEVRSVFTKNFLGEISSVEDSEMKFFIACISCRPEYMLRNISIGDNKSLLYSFYIWFRLPDLAKLYSADFFISPIDRNIISRFLVLPILMLFKESESKMYDDFIKQYQNYLQPFEDKVLDIIDIYCFKNLANEKNILGFLKNFKNGIYEDLSAIDKPEIKTFLFDKLDSYQRQLQERQPILFYFINVLENMLDTNFQFNKEFRSNLDNLLSKLFPLEKASVISRIGLLINMISCIQKLNVCSKTKNFKHMTTIFMEIVNEIIKVYVERKENRKIKELSKVIYDEKIKNEQIDGKDKNLNKKKIGENDEKFNNELRIRTEEDQANDLLSFNNGNNEVETQHLEHEDSYSEPKISSEQKAEELKKICKVHENTNKNARPIEAEQEESNSIVHIELNSISLGLKPSIDLSKRDGEGTDKQNGKGTDKQNGKNDNSGNGDIKTIIDSLTALVNNPAFPYNNFKDYINLIKILLNLMNKKESSPTLNTKASKTLMISSFFQSPCHNLMKKNAVEDFIKEESDDDQLSNMDESCNIINTQLSVSDIIINICEESFKVIEFMKDQEKSCNKEERRLIIIKYIGAIIDKLLYVKQQKGDNIKDFFSIKKKLKIIFKNIVFLTKAEFEYLTPDIHFLFGIDASEFGKIKEKLIGFREVIKGPQQFIDTKFNKIMEKIINTNLTSVQNILRKFSFNEELSVFDLFKLVDKDRSGNISLQEFKVLTRRLNIDLSDHRIKEIFTSIKLNSDIATPSVFALDEKEFELSINYLQNKSIMLTLETLGLTQEFLTGLLFFLTVVLLVVFAFIFLGVEAFAIAGTFGAVVNSSFPVAAGAVLSKKSNTSYADILKREEFKNTVNKCVKIVQSMKI